MTERKVNKIDWTFLVFLLLFTNQAIFSLKIVGLVFICLARFNWNFGFRKGRLPKFYPYIILLAVFNLLFHVRDFRSDYLTAFVVGNLFWIFSAIAAHQAKISVEKYGPEGVYATLKAFTVINFVVCMFQLVRIMLITGTLNPYDPNIPFPYGVSTGDFIFGTFMEVSYYNTMVSALLAIYFIFKRNATYTLLATISFVLVFGNFGTIVFVGILAGLLVAGLLAAIAGNRRGFAAWLKNVSPPGAWFIYLPGIFIFIATMYYIASPKNYDYIVTKIKDKVFSVKKEDEHNFATMIDDQKPKAEAFDPFSNYYEKKEKERQKKSDFLNDPSYKSTRPDQKIAAKMEVTKTYFEKLQGKNLSMLETVAYLKESKAQLLLGAGTTRFSSLTAQKMSGFDSSRLFMGVLPQYRSREYTENHYLILLERNKTKDMALLSAANRPDSIYNQLLGEYGLLGMLGFILFYIGFFVRRIGRWTYSLWLFLVLLPFAHLNYIFDTLCVMPFFELMLYSDIAADSKPEEQ